MKHGLVLEGGAMRGLFTAGVMDVMMEAGIRYDGIIGVSAGSSFGCNYKSHQPGRVLRYNLRFHNDPRYMGLRSLLTTGDLVGAEFAYHTLPLSKATLPSFTWYAPMCIPASRSIIKWIRWIMTLLNGSEPPHLCL